MVSAPARDFERVLGRLLRARTHRISSVVQAKPGPAPNITRAKLTNAIDKLQSLAERELLRQKHVKGILQGFNYKKQWHAKKGKGWGVDAKKKNFKQWYERHIRTRNCVYAFWSRSKCVYVGRTLNGKGRPTSHFDKRWFGSITRLDIYGFDRKREVPRFECMLTHRHRPTQSKIRPATKKYYARCPICEARKKIRNEMRSLFRLR